MLTVGTVANRIPLVCPWRLGILHIYVHSRSALIGVIEQLDAVLIIRRPGQHLQSRIRRCVMIRYQHRSFKPVLGHTPASGRLFVAIRFHVLFRALHLHRKKIHLTFLVCTDHET